MIDELRKNEQLWRRYTREEEYAPPFLDKYGRFLYRASAERDVLDPSVSRHLHERGLRVEYPGGKKFAVCLTHDIDMVRRSARSQGFDALSSMAGGQLSKGLADARRLMSRRPQWLDLGEIMALEEKYGARSSFYFLALARGDRDHAYDVQDIEREIREIAGAGWEVGLHGGHRAYAEPEALAAEKRRLEEVLGRPVIGYRNHYLRFRVPDTWASLSKAGFRYDSTMGYTDCVGFRNGMCHPYRPYDPRADREIDILEVPPNIIDGTLFRFMLLDRETAWELTQRLVDATERYQGVITVLWHNHNMFGEELKFYERLLQYCLEKEAWMTSGAEIETHWEHAFGHRRGQDDITSVR